jgi:hypothetical protein
MMFSGVSENESKDKRMSRRLLEVVRAVVLLVVGCVVFDDKVRGIIEDATPTRFSGSGERAMLSK